MQQRGRFVVRWTSLYITGCAQRVGCFTYQGQSVFSNGCFGARRHHAHFVYWCWLSHGRVWCHSHCSSSQCSGRALREGILNLPGTAVFSSASSGACLLAPFSGLRCRCLHARWCAVCGSLRRCWWFAFSVAALNDAKPMFTCSLNLYSS